MDSPCTTNLRLQTELQTFPMIHLSFRFFFDVVCKTFGDGWDEKAWLCFASGMNNQCKSFDGLHFATETRTSNNHSFTKILGSYNGNPFIGDSENVRTEIIEQRNHRTDWTDSELTLSTNYPFASNK